jgi:hypothetical protein
VTEDREITAARGRRAQELLDDDILKGAFEELERNYVEVWRATHIDNVTGREKLFLAINVVGKVRDHLISISNNGKLAAEEIRRMADEQERKRLFGLL